MDTKLVHDQPRLDCVKRFKNLTSTLNLVKVCGCVHAHPFQPETDMSSSLTLYLCVLFFKQNLNHILSLSLSLKNYFDGLRCGLW